MGTNLPRITSRRARLGTLGAVLLFGIAVSGCSSSGSSSAANDGSGTSTPTTASNKPVAVPPPCSVAPLDVVDGALHGGVGTPTSQRNGSIRTCTFPGPPGGDDVVIRFQSGVGADDFAAAEQSPGPSGNPGTPVAGLGDAAYATSRGEVGNQLNTLAVLSGSTEVAISAPVPLADLEALARTLLGRL